MASGQPGSGAAGKAAAVAAVTPQRERALKRDGSGPLTKEGSLEGFHRVAAFSGAESTKERQARLSAETILPADNGVWQPFVDAKWLQPDTSDVA